MDNGIFLKFGCCPTSSLWRYLQGLNQNVTTTLENWIHYMTFWFEGPENSLAPLCPYMTGCFCCILLDQKHCLIFHCQWISICNYCTIHYLRLYFHLYYYSYDLGTLGWCQFHKRNVWVKYKGYYCSTFKSDIIPLTQTVKITFG